MATSRDGSNGKRSKFPVQRGSSNISTSPAHTLSGPSPTHHVHSQSQHSVAHSPQSDHSPSIQNTTSFDTTNHFSQPESSDGPSQQADHSSDSRDRIVPPGIDDELFLHREGKFGFKPSNKAARKITEIIHRRLHGGCWITYGQVPCHEKEIWWNEWKKEVSWAPRDETHMKGAFKFKVSSHLRYIWWKARRDNVKPDMVDNDVWTKAKKYFLTPDYKRKRLINKKNRASDTGGALHRMGSISAGTHIMKIEQKTGKKPRYIDFFDQMHKMPDGSFVDARSERTSKAVHDVINSQPETVDTEEVEQQCWREALGGPNSKGVDYGINYISQNSTYNVRDTQSTIDPVVQVQLESLNQKVDDSQEKVARCMEEITSTQKQMALMMQQMMSMMRNGHSTPQNDAHGGPHE